MSKVIFTISEEARKEKEKAERKAAESKFDFVYILHFKTD